MTVQGGGLSSLGVGTAIVDDTAHDETEVIPEVVPEATEESEPAQDATEETTTDVAE